MRTWTFTTRSQSVYRVTEDNGEWKFGAVEVPSKGFGTVFLGASTPIAKPVPWPLEVGQHATFFSPDGDTPIVATSRVESVTEASE